jgi:hypothetical protein
MDGSGFQPSVCRDLFSWGVAPGWYGVAPLALCLGEVQMWIGEELFRFEEKMIE